jgi:hypothetical protein
MWVFAIWIEDALTMPMDRLQHSHLGEKISGASSMGTGGPDSHARFWN